MEADDILARAEAWHAEGHAVALATVIETWGSSPRPAGSMLAIRGDMLMEGSVSGGCVEGRVVEEALEVMETRAARTLSFGVGDEEAWDVGLACGGRIQIYVEPLPVEIIGALRAAHGARRPVVLVKDLDIGEQRVIGPEDASTEADRCACDQALAADRPQRLGSRFFQPHALSLRLIVIGGGHIALPLVAMARLAGYGVAVVDPRTAFANPQRFDGVAISNAWPDEALAELAVDARTAVVALSHDPKIDDPALAVALRSPAFYVGALGSRRTHAARLQRLREQQIEQPERIHGPIGLSIGASSPAEIAISIMAEITQELRMATTAPAAG